MHKLDPIERLPDGSLFSPDAGAAPQRARSTALLQLLGWRLPAAGRCSPAVHFSKSTLAAGFAAPCCPSSPSWNRPFSARKTCRCEVCGKSILAHSGRTKYCPSCAKEVHRQQKAKSARKRRTGVDNFGGEKPLNCKHSCTAETVRQYDFPRSLEIEFTRLHSRRNTRID